MKLRALQLSDARDWRNARRTNELWLGPWEATLPRDDPSMPHTFRGTIRELQRQAREGRTLPMALLVDGRFAGQVSVSNIVWGSARFGQIGYWISKDFAGQGHMPLAVAMTIDACFFELRLHRVEIAIRPENLASLRVVEKLGIPEVGYAPNYLHIDGAWRDHRLFAVSIEDAPGGVLDRYLAKRAEGPQSSQA